MNRIEREGWSLGLAKPSTELGEELVRLVVATAAGRGAQPLRRSRRATTFNVRVPSTSGAGADIFVKVLDAPRGLDRLKRKLRGSLASHVTQVTAQMAAAGICAPPVWIHGRERASGRELIVTPRAPGRGPLRALEALAGSLADKRAALATLGVEIARMHRAGFVHGDLTPFNIFVAHDQPPRCIFLDHERTRLSFAIGRRRRAMRNLVQLGRFDLPRITRSDRQRVLRSYGVAMSWRDPRKMNRRVAARIQRRIRRDGSYAVVAPLAHLVKGDIRG
ncbi:MAG: lipopolysaccharide kinase InaA family protein [Candidatus Binataceae bacterium]